MSEHIRVTVTIDTNELLHWADRHADAGNHGVAHVLYTAAKDGESLTDQAIAAEVAKERERIGADTLELVREWTQMDGRLVLRDRDLSDFRDGLADVISGRAS